jgi:hypothetical protein
MSFVIPEGMTLEQMLKVQAGPQPEAKPEPKPAPAAVAPKRRVMSKPES